MIRKILKLLWHPRSEYKKIAPFFRTKIRSARRALIVYNQRKERERLLSAYRSLNLVKIHFGCGPRVLGGWINIDLHFEPFDAYLKYYGDTYPEEMRGTRSDFYALNILHVGFPLPDNSVDIIFHEDFLEHLDQKEQIIFLAEMFRVLKPGAIHRVNTPDLLATMRRRSDFTQGINGIYEREWSGKGHKNILTPYHLKELARMVGYRNVIFNKRNQSISKEIPLEYRPGNDRLEDENIFADLVK